ncbi:haloacid dehalogenase [Streptomyces resistomycificus]|uniref:Haloacid dehalogenase n=1 Tax=Streptomyces resistomycificus TaxID=67356 RepID=A0A0L8KYV8_9ACTN|nr:haloacid dehalogenase [Streptomyces resistomycificus]
MTRTLTAAQAVLVDFDGPLCNVFAGLPAQEVARKLSQIAADHDPELWGKLAEITNPLEVLALTYDFDRSVSGRVEEALISAEVEAVQVAGDPIAGSIEALTAIRESGRRIAVVTNNSTECVRRFLARHDLSDHVDAVVGRTLNRPDLMKPHPHALLQAAERLDVSPKECVLIGDSRTDIQAAHAAGGTAIGYANKARKRRVFVEADAEAIIERMRAIAHALS